MARTLVDVLKASSGSGLVEEGMLAMQLAEMFVEKRIDAACVGSKGVLVGVVSVRDIVKLVSRRADLRSLSVGEFMTRNPVVLPGEATTVEAISAMRSGGFRHIPVVDGEGQYLGVVDAIELIYDAIIKMQTQFIPTRRAFTFFRSKTEALRVPTLSSIADASEAAVLTTEETLLTACELMTETRGTAVAVTNSAGVLAGIVTSRDVLKSIVGNLGPAQDTRLFKVMSRDPEYASGSDTLLLALQKMQARGFRHLPVIDTDKRVVSLVSVLEVAGNAILDDGDLNQSTTTIQADTQWGSGSGSFWNYFFSSASLNGESIEPKENFLSSGGNAPVPKSISSFLVFKFQDKNREFRRVKVPMRLERGSYDKFQLEIRRRYGASRSSVLKIKYFDDEGDEVRISSDEDFEECIESALENQWKTVKAVVEEVQTLTDTSSRGSISASLSYGSLLDLDAKDYGGSQIATAYSAQDKIREAMGLLQNGNVKAAITCYDEAVSIDPSSANAYCGRAAAKLIVHETEQALEDYDKALELCGQRQDIIDQSALESFMDVCNSGIAEALIELRRYEEAGKILSSISSSQCRDETVSAFLDELSACRDSAVKAQLSDACMEAVDLYTSAIRIDSTLEKEIGHPRQAKLLCARGQCYVTVDDVEMAAEDYFLALQVDPENRDALLGRAEALKKLEKYKEAKDAFRTYFKLFPKDEKAVKSFDEVKKRVLEADSKKISDLGSVLKEINLPKI
ncbi:hypothetical protein NDN08_001220 [Rhodosorus marinus]|uniref:Uncharacterized protein n=1 Tax=Rhodosorus marinus TaxID=101924 RepID=A0AAV8UUD7_9RHOD|nr:hypothetical protein NDN08_001220 [Rhodosorus marinus]